MVKKPWLARTLPIPPQVRQVDGDVPALAPEPEQLSQATDVGTLTCASTTSAASTGAFQHWDMAFVISAECGVDLMGYLHGTVAPEQFVDAMLGYVEDQRLFPR